MRTATIFVITLLLLVSSVFAQDSDLAVILSDASCPAACYLGIVPGVTTQAELETILRQRDIKFSAEPIGPSEKLMVYSFAAPASPSLATDKPVYVDVTADTVDRITLFLADVTFSQIASGFGAPDLVASNAQAGNSILYVDKGLEFVSLTNDSEAVDLVFLMPPGRNGLVIGKPCQGTTGVCALATATPISTSTPVPVVTTDGSFPTTGVLDNFDRRDGGIGANWSGDTAVYQISSDSLDVVNTGTLYWNATAFEANQEVYVTLDAIDVRADEIDLILKSQSSTSTNSGALEVWYKPSRKSVQVFSYDATHGWVQQGKDIPVSFAAGDVFGAQAYADGSVGVYQNSTLMGTVSVTNWPFNGKGGYVGLWTIGANDSLFDDFGGGSLAEGAAIVTTPEGTDEPAQTPTASS